MRILIASGGSGGHIFPALSLAKELKKEEIDIIFVASRRRLDKGMLKDEPYKKVFLSVNPMPYTFGLSTFTFWIKLIFDSVYSSFIILRARPKVVVGFGGYTSGAIVLLASLFGIKTVIHEQNLVPGRTNRILDKLVSKVATSFEETEKYFKNKNITFTGNPLREESLVECREKAFKNFDLDKHKLTILVMGGSQGARSLNKVVSKSISLIPGEKRKNIQLVHIAGPNNVDFIKDSYRKSGVDGKVFGFIDNINEAYSVSDIAISRSGAAALFELASFAKPMILIPYPNEKNNQRFNAEYFQRKSAAISFDEKTLKNGELTETILDLIKSPDKRKSLSESARRLSITDGAKRLKEAVLDEV